MGVNPDKQLSQFQVNHHADGDYYTIESCYTPTHALNVSGNNQERGTPVILWDNMYNQSTQWKITKVGGGKFNPNEWAQPHIHAFLDSHGLQEMPAWLVAELPSKRRYAIENKNEPGKFLSAHGVADSGYGLPGGANLVLWDNPGSPESQWYLLGAGFFDVGGGKEMERHILVNVGSQRTLVVSRHDRRTGGPVLQSWYPFSQESIFQVHKDPHYKTDAFLIQSIYNPTQYINKGYAHGNGTKCITNDNTWEWSNHWFIKQVGGPTGPMFPLGGSRLKMMANIRLFWLKRFMNFMMGPIRYEYGLNFLYQFFFILI